MATNNILNTSLVGQSGSGAFAGTTSPVLTTPDLGAALATSINFGGGALGAYEIGTWTPTFSFSTPGTSVITHSSQIGYYVRIGGLVYVTLNIAFTVTSLGTASGQMNIGGLPVTVASTLTAYGSAACSPNITFPGSRTQIGFVATVGTNIIAPVSQGSGLGSIGFGTAQLTAGVSTSFLGTVIYQV